MQFALRHDRGVHLVVIMDASEYLGNSTTIRVLVVGRYALPFFGLFSRQNKGGKDVLSRAILP